MVMEIGNVEFSCTPCKMTNRNMDHSFSSYTCNISWHAETGMLPNVVTPRGNLSPWK